MDTCLRRLVMLRRQKENVEDSIPPKEEIIVEVTPPPLSGLLTVHQKSILKIVTTFDDEYPQNGPENAPYFAKRSSG